MSKRVLWEAHTSEKIKTLDERIEKLEKNFGSENVAMVEFRKEIAEIDITIIRMMEKRIEKLEELECVDNNVFIAELVKRDKEIAELKMDIKNIIGDEKDFLDDINELREVLQELIEGLTYKSFIHHTYSKGDLLQQLEGEKSDVSVINETQLRDTIKSGKDHTDSTPSNKADMIVYDGEVTVVETDDLRKLKENNERLEWFLMKYLEEEKTSIDSRLSKRKLKAWDTEEK